MNENITWEKVKKGDTLFEARSDAPYYGEIAYDGQTGCYYFYTVVDRRTKETSRHRSRKLRNIFRTKRECLCYNINEGLAKIERLLKGIERAQEDIEEVEERLDTLDTEAEAEANHAD